MNEHIVEAREAWITHLDSIECCGRDRAAEVLEGREDACDFIAGYLAACADIQPR